MRQATHIPQKGGGAAATAVLNGTATFLCTNSSALASFVANGQLVPLMVTTPEPVVGFDAPTATDLGKPSLDQLVGWTGIAGPDDLPDDVAEKWGEWMAEPRPQTKASVSKMDSAWLRHRVDGPERCQRISSGPIRDFPRPG